MDRIVSVWFVPGSRTIMVTVAFREVSTAERSLKHKSLKRKRPERSLKRELGDLKIMNKP